ncbi:Histone deacetylase 15 [Camellia lanceoleosa]|uniref:Histone deacetylase 15 n=1 Tax=Camellia lanceoleosa TaxID=1840588 RepID=A0ACC0FDY0_9ERIC|nr:Histone deacetylase 15 [Camellia lanceoleosa]
MSRLANGEAEHNLHNQRDQSLCQGYSGRNGNVGSVVISSTTNHDGNYEEERASRISVRDTADNMNGNMQPDVISKKARQQKEMTLEDMYNNQYDFDDDDDDSDWEPSQKLTTVVKWFCVNCTMVNLDDVVHCDICGEHKESGIVKHGFFASPFLKEVGLTQNESEIERYKDSCSRFLVSDNSTAIGFDERMLLHSEVELKSHPHPERPDRLRAIAASLATAGIFPGRCVPISAREITQKELHTVRPPGHHAGVRHAMGFCHHNNAAVAALAVQAAGAKKVLIVDWDVHHGNGTQEIFEGNKSVLYISLHRHEGGKFYPGTGAAHEVGTRGAEGYCVNVPWSHGGVGDNDYIFAFQHVVLPIASEFAPDFTIISAGFDAARGDPLGCCDVTPAGFAQMTHMLNALSGGKLLVILEGGYNLRSISSSATAVIKVLLGESPGCEVVNVVPSKSGLVTVLEVLKIQMNFWPALESFYSKLHSQWGPYAFQDRKKQSKKRQRSVVPIWWQCGQKRRLNQDSSESLDYNYPKLQREHQKGV